MILGIMGAISARAGRDLILGTGEGRMERVSMMSVMVSVGVGAGG
jgi:hypothetical protein